MVESEIKPQVVDDAAVPGGYTVVESEAADAKKPGYTVIESDSTEPAVPPSSPSVPAVMIPMGQAMEEISSIQIGDVLIIAVKVQPKQEPEATG